MKPLEISAAISALCKDVGPNAAVWVSVEAVGGWHSKPLSLTIYPEGICKDIGARIEADEWDELFAKSYEAWGQRQNEFRCRKIQKMALEIIRLTMELGECTDAALRGSEFTSEDVSTYGAEAVQTANLMADKGPFEIITIADANAAQAIADEEARDQPQGF